MKIGIDGRAAKWYRGTGIGTYTHELIRSLSNTDSINDYSIFMPDCELKNTLSDNFKINNVDTDYSNNFWDEVNVPNILNTSDIQLYHVPQNGVGLSKCVECKKVITLHDIIPLRMPETVSDRYLRIFNNELPKIVQMCDGIITVSEFSKHDISKQFNIPEEKIFVTHLAAENLYTPLSKCESKKAVTKKYDIEEDFILYVGGFSPRKNIVGLIESYSLLPINLRNRYKLVIIGKKGKSYSIYKKRTEELNIDQNVIFTDFVPLEDMPLFYNAAEVLVYPSFYEGFGLPPIEAMACGTPVITSNVTSLKEICQGSAILVNPEDIDMLSENIERVLTNSLLRLTLVRKSLEKSKEFSWNKTALKTINAYNKILS